MRFLLLVVLMLLVCLSAGCGSAPRAAVVDTRPTAAQAQAHADAALPIPDLSAALAAAKQAEADDHARVIQLAADLAAAQLHRNEMICSLIAVLAVFVAGAAEVLALYEITLAWLLKPFGYALAGVAVTAACLRVALPYLGIAEVGLLFAVLAVAIYSLRKTSLGTAVEAEAGTLIGDVETEAKALLIKAHLAKAVLPAASITIPATAPGV